MAQKKGSKNAIENRGATTVMVCATCNDTMKPIKFIEGNRKKMVYECKCGILDKQGVKI